MRWLPMRFVRRVAFCRRGCWEWRGQRDPDGYGRFKLAGKKWRVHRLAFIILVGPIAPGIDLHHTCHNRACVNPAHLMPLARGLHALLGNTPIAVNARKTCCFRGHCLSGDNVYLTTNRRGHVHRTCRICRRIYARPNTSRAAKTDTAPRMKSHCPQGHPYADDNLYVDPSGSRFCRECRRLRKRRARAKLSGAAA